MKKGILVGISALMAFKFRRLFNTGRETGRTGKQVILAGTFLQVHPEV